MSRFDEIRCDVALPDAGPTEGIHFQTKSFPVPSMQRYAITKPGRLLDMLGRDLEPDGYVTFGTPNAVPPHSECRQYGARFLSGQLLKVVLVEHNRFDPGGYGLASFRWFDEPSALFGEPPRFGKQAFTRAMECLITPPAVPGMYSDHQRTDARALALHCLIARKLLVNPKLLDEARDMVAHWRLSPDKPPESNIEKWDRILETSTEQIAYFLASMSEDAARLRHFSPFTGFVTPEERSRIYGAFS
jgi:hypothetical protein